MGLCIPLLGAIACGQPLLEALEGAEVGWKLLKSAITSFPTAVKQLPPVCSVDGPVPVRLFHATKQPC